MLFVMLLIAPPTAVVLAQEADLSDWMIHPSVAGTVACSFLPVQLFGETYVAPQLRTALTVRSLFYLSADWYFGLGVNGVYSADTTPTKLIMRPGMTALSADLAFGYLPRPHPQSIVSPGLEVRGGAQYGLINGTELYSFFLQTTIRPYLRLLGQHLEIGLPLTLAFRKDPAPAFDLGLELALVL